MRESIIPPIITDENGDILFHPTPEAAAAALEAIDVLNGEYEIFDSSGTVMKAMIVESLVQITVDDSQVRRPDLLSRRLQNFVERIGPERLSVPGAVSSLTLPELVDLLSGFFES